jgi:transcriptional regulator with XRE-family HTH domain
MRIQPELTDETVLIELGERLARLRLSRDLTQRRLGEQAGVGRTVVQRIEAGEAVTTANLVRVLRALDSLDSLDRLLPEDVPSPVQELKLRGRQRRRASGAHGNGGEGADQARPWRWGDES